MSKRITGLFTFILVALALVAGATQDFNFQGTQASDPGRINVYTVPNVQRVPLVSGAGTGHVASDTSLTDGDGQAFTIANTNQPDSIRELVIFQDDASGTNLSITYHIGVVNLDGTETTATVTLTSDTDYVFPFPVVGVTDVYVDITNAAASDYLKVGYRGFYIPGSWITDEDEILLEAIAGVAASTAGTVPQDNFYVPNSISAGNSLLLVTRTVGTPPNKKPLRPWGSAANTVNY